MWRWFELCLMSKSFVSKCRLLVPCLTDVMLLFIGPPVFCLLLHKEKQVYSVMDFYR